MRTNLRIALLMTFLAGVVWAGAPGCASTNKTTARAIVGASNATETGPHVNRRIEIAIDASAALQEDARRRAAAR